MKDKKGEYKAYRQCYPTCIMIFKKQQNIEVKFDFFYTLYYNKVEKTVY